MVLLCGEIETFESMSNTIDRSGSCGRKVGSNAEHVLEALSISIMTGPSSLLLCSISRLADM